MKLNKSDFRGTSRVYRFTLTQLLRNKANIISLVISVLTMLILMPVITLISGSNIAQPEPDFPEEDLNSYPAVVYYINETSLAPDFSLADYGSSRFVPAEFSRNDYEEYTGEENAFVHFYWNDNSLCIDVYNSVGSEEELGWVAQNLLRTAMTAGSEEGLEILNSPYSINICNLDTYEEGDAEEFSMSLYYLQLIYSILVIMVSLHAASYIVQSVVEEKASKLVETLMISVKPLALILGKILAVMTFVFGMISLNILAAAFSGLINRHLMGGAGITEIIAGMGVDMESLRFTPIAIVAVVVSLILGYLTYSLLAGMSGAGCSSQNDVQAATSLSMTIIMVCYMIALFSSMAESEGVLIAVSLLPMISVFCAPIHYMTGNIGFSVLAVSWLLQIAVIAVLALMCAKVYADLIIYNGKRLTFRQITKMAVGKRKGDHT